MRFAYQMGTLTGGASFGVRVERFEYLQLPLQYIGFVCYVQIDKAIRIVFGQYETDPVVVLICVERRYGGIEVNPSVRIIDTRHKSATRIIRNLSWSVALAFLISPH